MMSMSLVIVNWIAKNTPSPAAWSAWRRPGRLRDRRVHQWLLRRQAAGQQLHRHARHEPDHHRLRLLHLRSRRSVASSRAVPEDRHPAGVRAPAVLLLPGASRSSCGSCSSTLRSAATCSPPAATPRRRAWRGSPPTGWCGNRCVVSGVVAGFAGVVYSWKVGTSGRHRPGLPVPGDRRRVLGASQFKGRPNVWGTIIALLALAPASRASSSTSRAAVAGSSRCSRACRCSVAVSLASRSQVIKIPGARRRQNATGTPTRRHHPSDTGEAPKVSGSVSRDARSRVKDGARTAKLESEKIYE